MMEQNVKPANPNRTAVILIAILLAALDARSGLAQAPSTRPARGRPPVPRSPQYVSTSLIPDRLLDRGVRQVIVLPSEPMEAGEEGMQRSGGAIGRIAPDVRRLPEGYIVAGRGARVERDGEWYVFRLEQSEGLPNAPPLRVLPNSQHAVLDAMMTGSEGRSFLVTGRVTDFQGNNYLLIESLMEGSSGQRAPAPRLEPEKKVPQPSPALPNETKDETSSSTLPAHEPTAEEVVKKLMENKPRRALVLPQRAAEKDSPPAPTNEANAKPSPENDAVKWAEDSVIVDRPARIVPGQRWWMLAFDDAGSAPKDKPIALLPNQLLETAIALTGGGARGVVLIISGEITAYKGTNYLLLRKVLVRRDLGNFR